MRHNNKKLNRKASRIIGSIALILAFIFLGIIQQGCAEHSNPFDPASSTGGEPFELKASPYFGRIDLTWNEINSLDENGNPTNPFDIDFFQVWRKAENEDWTIIADTTRELSYQDSTVEDGKQYTYRINARRGSQQSDFSASVTMQSCWYPGKLGTVEGFYSAPRPKDIAFCTKCGRYYVVNELQDLLFVFDQFDDRYVAKVEVGNLPTGVDFWHNNTTGEDTIITCNKGDKTLSFVARDTAAGEFAVDTTIDMSPNRPQSIQISASRKAYLSFENIGKVIRMDIGSLQIEDSLSVEGGLNRLHLIKDSKLLLGVYNEQKKIAVIDIEDWFLKHRVNVANAAVDLAILSKQNLIYTACDTVVDGLSAIKINVINVENGTRVPSRELIISLPEGVFEIHSAGVSIIPGCLDDGLLFVCAETQIPQSETRIFGYHIGTGFSKLVSMETIIKEIPWLIRHYPDETVKKLYVLHTRGIKTFF